MNGKLIVVEGLDGSGKATQSALLCENLLRMGEKVRKVSFPAYDSASSALVKMYLAGEFGTDPGDVNPYAASSFYAVDRFASYKKEWADFYKSGGIIVADRYTTSNAIHQCSKLDQKEWDDFLSWLFTYEYQLLGIPAPDLVIYLKTDPEISQKLMTKRYSGDEEKKDIHEKNILYLKNSKKAAEYCAKALNWKTIQCDLDGRMRPVQDIQEEVGTFVKEAL